MQATIACTIWDFYYVNITKNIWLYQSTYLNCMKASSYDTTLIRKQKVFQFFAKLTISWIQIQVISEVAPKSLDVAIIFPRQPGSQQPI